MPNWCENELRVSSKNEDYKEIIEFIKKNTDDEGVFRLSCLIPIPEEIANTQCPNSDTPERKQYLIDKYGAEDWYEWRLNNYGCKWDCDSNDVPTIDEIEKYKNTYLFIYFESPWSPPDRWFDKLCKTFPNLCISLKYEEEGNAFMGVMKNHNGTMTNEYLEW